MTTNHSLLEMSDAQLVAEVKTRAALERAATAELIGALVELDARRLYLGEGCSSLFTYCTHVLRLSEYAAYGRIEAARAVRRFPQILELLFEGALTLTSVCLLAPVLMPDTACAVLHQARYKSKREVEVLVATLRPQPPVPSSVRKLPPAKTAGRPELEATPPPPSSSYASAPFVSTLASTPLVALPRRAAVLVPLAPEQYKVQCTVSRDTYEKLRRAQDLLRT